MSGQKCRVFVKMSPPCPKRPCGTIIGMVNAAVLASSTNISLIAGGIVILGFLAYLWRSRVVSKREEEAAKKHEVDEKTAPKTRFKDVAGCEEAVEEMREIVAYLHKPERFEKLGAKPPRGALLVGPPGTGKTLLARAVAGEAGVAFFHHSGSDFVELFVGAGAKKIRELYAKANEVKNAIVFIDEIDAIGKKRGGPNVYSTGSNDEQEHTLIALLTELDGFSESGVFTIAATNRPEILDPALLRPGRLERKISVPSPDRGAREQILRVHAAKKPLNKDVDLSFIAKRTSGMSGADLAGIVNEAALEAARQDRDDINASCFEHAIATTTMGRARKSATVTEEDRRITAWHEAGHAVVAKIHQDATDPAAVSITPRGQAGGVTWMEGSDNSFLTVKAAKARLAVALAGRAAEEILLDGEYTHGAVSDLATATELANAMVRQFGMTKRGLSSRPLRAGDPYDAQTFDMVDSLLQDAMSEAREMLGNNIDILEKLAEKLLECDTLHKDELEEIFNKREPKKTKKPTKKQPAVIYEKETEPVLIKRKKKTFLRLIHAVVKKIETKTAERLQKGSQKPRNA